MIRVLSLVLVMLLSLGSPVSMAAEDDKPADYISYIELKPFVTNFGSADNLRFLKAEVTIQVDSENAHHAVNAHMAQIRNDLVFLFSAQTEESVGSVAAQQLLAGEALKLIQDMLKEETGESFVTDLFFTSLVVQ
ncbi:Flagellar biosynthesis protein FliL [Marinobacterium lacunae]|uniref:Flagellar protein FliL n=1 Tax=Marinobacterium lacunae TaxID=1232683 RepID=A0A081FYB7_9GAMM|nr:flagellar basal body-associated FliL family protein [Marinobacterium lacunae]KEA63522.1 Flagellar biosynthesis protein FliL [Marinobacterium lacunae]MBR9885597.1 flagellar basal body-associated protein FliL [Oceanospirillales bacterium]